MNTQPSGFQWVSQVIVDWIPLALARKLKPEVC